MEGGRKIVEEDEELVGPPRDDVRTRDRFVAGREEREHAAVRAEVSKDQLRSAVDEMTHVRGPR